MRLLFPSFLFPNQEISYLPLQNNVWLCRIPALSSNVIKLTCLMHRPSVRAQQFTYEILSISELSVYVIVYLKTSDSGSAS